MVVSLVIGWEESEMYDLPTFCICHHAKLCVDVFHNSLSTLESVNFV